MSDVDIARDSTGRWLPGRSANPSEVPREVMRVKRIAQGHGPEMLQALVDIVRDKKAPHAARVAAAREVLDRGFGRPAASVSIDVNDDGAPSEGEVVNRIAELANRLGVKIDLSIE